jgi:hypothetical protein
VRRALAALAASLAVLATLPETALAHGLVGRSDLPIPEWLFGWAAAVVLIVSFVALAALWPEPKLNDEDWRPLPGGIWRVLGSPGLENVCQTIGALLLFLVVWAGLAGEQSATGNIVPTLIYVIFWLGLVLASVLFGDVFRAFNPWRAIARFVAGASRLVTRGALPEPLPYPRRLGYYPAAAGLFCFAWMELVATNGDSPQNLAIATLIYSAVTFVAVALYGIEPWLDRGEAFSVYFNLFSRISPFERRNGVVGLRKPLSGLVPLPTHPGIVVLLAVMIGSVTFDGAAEGSVWGSIAPDIQDGLKSLGMSPQTYVEVSFGIGLILCILLVLGFYWLGVLGTQSVGGGFGVTDLARRFVHSLVPIALVYVAAHYVTLLLYQGQAIAFLASDPLGKGWDLFGTAGNNIDYGVISATQAWYVQVGFVVAGHVSALMLAHDRALVLYDKPRLAVRSQYWMLGVMVGFTSLALWLLSQANA